MSEWLAKLAIPWKRDRMSEIVRSSFCPATQNLNMQTNPNNSRQALVNNP